MSTGSTTDPALDFYTCINFPEALMTVIDTFDES